MEELYKKEISVEAILEDLDKEIKEEVEDILYNLDYLPQAYQGYYCEDIHSKEEIEQLKDNLYFIDNDGFIATKDDILGWDVNTYYYWWDGHNNRCSRVEWLEELEVEEIDEYDEIQKFEKEITDYDYRKTYHYNYYKTKNGKIFRV